MALSAIELLSEAHRFVGFDCGKPALNHWLETFALSNQSAGFTRVLVTHEEGQVVGFYGLAPSVIEPLVVPRAIRTGRPPDPIPCLLIGQLAVDRRHWGRGIGGALMRDALQRCVAGAEVIGGRAVVVRAIDAQAEAYWQSWGFIPARNNASVLVRSIDDIRRWLAGQ